MTWEKRFGALVELEGDEWKAVHDRLERDWLAAYTVAIFEIAVSRGWRWKDAGTWPVGTRNEAFIEAYRYKWEPWPAIAHDLVACEDCSPTR